jgi:RpiB/LacA/LacB family sugar-phosphate isomerase
MKIAVGADHRGYKLKSKLAAFLKDEGHQVLDMGTDSTEPCDYPPIGYNVAKSVAKKESDRGVLICMSGIGMSIVANKVPGVRAAMCDTAVEAGLSREHNDSNVIIISAKYVKDKPEDILRSWFESSITEERHKRRVSQIIDIENKILKGEL